MPGGINPLATETELKLGVAPGDIEALLRHPLLAADATARHLANTYFDTEDLALTRQKVAVRERRVTDQTLLTVKTAGRSIGGLSQRQEWEAPTHPGAFDFMRLVTDTPLAERLTQLAAQLVPVFTTDFERLSWCIPVNDSRGESLVEIALDRGAIEVTRHGRLTTSPICELELELKQGQPEALFILAEQLKAYAPLQPIDESKAARGYALFHSLAE